MLYYIYKIRKGANNPDITSKGGPKMRMIHTTVSYTLLIVGWIFILWVAKGAAPEIGRWLKEVIR